MSSLPNSLFAPSSGFRHDTRFGTSTDASLSRTPSEEAYDEGYAKGFEAATEQARAEAVELDAARGRIETAFARLAEAEGLRLEERLRETVMALCEQALAPLTQDPDALAGRVHKALSALRRAEDERVLRLHPDDMNLISDRLPDNLNIETDPSMTRGEIRIETAEGGVEDGPEQWRRVLEEALSL